MDVARRCSRRRCGDRAPCPPTMSQVLKVEILPRACGADFAPMQLEVAFGHHCPRCLRCVRAIQAAAGLPMASAQTSASSELKMLVAPRELDGPARSLRNDRWAPSDPGCRGKH